MIESCHFLCSLGVQFVTIHATTLSRHAKAVTFHNTYCGKVVTGDVTIHVMSIVGPCPVILVSGHVYNHD